MESILTSVKRQLGIVEGYQQFDADIIMHINTVFTILTQLGVGPKGGFSIKDGMEPWTDFVKESDTRFEAVKTYMGLRVRMLFDPPTSGIVAEAINHSISELEWRLTVSVETPCLGEEEGDGS